MNTFMNILHYAWDWIRIIFNKTCQTLRLMHELLRPGKSLTTRISFLVGIVVVIAFVINSFLAFYTTSVQLLADTTNRCSSDLAAVKAISDATLEDLDASSDTIRANDALIYLMKRLKVYKPSPKSYVCITDTAGNILHSDAKDLNRIMLNSEKDTIAFSPDGNDIISLSISNMVDYNNTKYSVESSPIWNGRWYVAVLHDTKDTWGKLFEIFFEVSKRCIISIMLALFGFIAMFVMMRHAMFRQTTIEGEIDHAGNIQQQMLPKAFPKSDRFNLHAFLRPAKTMGGDLYDFIERDNKLFFCLGDVSGKGMPAALLMSEVHSLFRNVARHTDKPEEIASAINVGVADGNDSNMFCTLFVGVLDKDSLMLNYCNAGHNPPVLLTSDSKPATIDVLPNLAVGLFEDYPYLPQQLQMTKGMGIFVYTDGITEAEDALNRLFSDEKLLNGLASCSSSTPEETINHVLTLVDKHARYADQSDDITMLCLKVS